MLILLEPSSFKVGLLQQDIWLVSPVLVVVVLPRLSDTASHQCSWQFPVSLPFTVSALQIKPELGAGYCRLASVEKRSSTALFATWLCVGGKISGTPVLNFAVTTTPMAAVMKNAKVVSSDGRGARS